MAIRSSSVARQQPVEFLLSVGIGLQEENGFIAEVLDGARTGVSSGDVLKNWGDGTLVLPPNTGEALEIVAPAGINTSMLLFGLGPGLTMQPFVVVETTGDTPVPIPGVWSRVHGLRNTGAVQITGGNVIVRPAGGGVSYAEASEATQRAFQGTFTIPMGWSGQVLSLAGTMEKSGGQEAGMTQFITTSKEGTVEVVDFGFGLQRSGDTSIEFHNPLPSRIEEGTNLTFRCDVTASGLDGHMRSGILLSNNAALGQ